MVTIYPDTSEWQVAVDDSFNREFFMFRISNESGRIDFKVNQNLGWSKTRRASGKIKQFGGYVIPCVVPNSTNLSNLDAVGFPKDAVVMIDLESWGGLVSGNHTSDLNALATSLRARQGGRADLVWLYANRGDFGSLYPGPRLPWLGLVVAGYQSQQPSMTNMIAWQYTNGTENYTSWPSATPPFGNCDHNALFAPIPLPGEEMPLTPADIKAIWDYGFASSFPVNSPIHPAREWLANSARKVDDVKAATDTLEPGLKALDTKVSNIKVPTAKDIADAVVAALPPASGGTGTALSDADVNKIAAAVRQQFVDNPIK